MSSVEESITIHLRDFAQDLEKYEVVKSFSYVGR